MSDYISKSEVMTILTDVELKEGTFTEAKSKIRDIPPVDEKEILRKPFERVVAKLENELKWTRAEQSIECTRRNGYGSPLQSKNSGKIEALKKAIGILKEECGISE